MTSSLKNSFYLVRKTKQKERDAKKGEKIKNFMKFLVREVQNKTEKVGIPRR